MGLSAYQGIRILPVENDSYRIDESASLRLEWRFGP